MTDSGQIPNNEKVGELEDINPSEDKYIGKWFVPLDSTFGNVTKIKSDHSVLIDNVVHVVFMTETDNVVLPENVVMTTMFPIDAPKQPKPVTGISTPPPPKISRSPAVELILGRKKRDNYVDVAVSLEIPTPEFISLILENYDISIESVLDDIIEEAVSIETIKKSLRTILQIYYNPNHDE